MKLINLPSLQLTGWLLCVLSWIQCYWEPIADTPCKFQRFMPVNYFIADSGHVSELRGVGCNHVVWLALTFIRTLVLKLPQLCRLFSMYQTFIEHKYLEIAILINPPKAETYFAFASLSLWYYFCENSVGAFLGILPHVTNIDNRSAKELICKWSLLCKNIFIATHTRNSTAPSLLWYGLVNSAQQRKAFSNDPTGVLYWVRLKASTELYMEDASVSTATRTSSDCQQQARSSRLECHLRRSVLIVSLVLRVPIK
jgi:hypothetical protein